MHDDAGRVRLERDQRERGPDSITEPESEGDCQMKRRGRVNGRGRVYVPVPDHLIVTVALARGNREFAPDIEPFSRVFVDLLFSDFHADIVDERVADVVHPEVGGVRRVGLGKWWQIHFNEQCGEQIGVTRDECSDAAPEIGISIKVNGDRFYRERGVTTIDVFEECELGVAR